MLVSLIDLGVLDATIAGSDTGRSGLRKTVMKRRLLFMILLIIVLAMILKYGVNAAPRLSDLPRSPAHPALTIG